MRIALLVSNSRESQNKAKQLGAAASEMGFEAKVFTGPPGPGFDVEIPCSDSRVLDTTWGARVGWMGSKTRSAEILRGLGIPALETCPVACQADVLRCEISGPIFVKSDRSSGVVAPHPFGYRRFDDVGAFYDYTRSKFPGALDDTGYRNTFGEYIIQPYIQNEGMITASFVRGVSIAPAFVKTDKSCFYEWMHFSGAREVGQSIMLQSLADFADAPFLYVQCLKHGDDLCPIDINVRLSTYLDTLMTFKNKAFYRWCIEVLAGNNSEFSIGEHLIGRIKTDFSRPCFASADKRLAELVNFGKLPAAAGKHDAAYSYPTYIISGMNCLERRAKFIETVVIAQ